MAESLGRRGLSDKSAVRGQSRAGGATQGFHGRSRPATLEASGAQRILIREPGISVLGPLCLAAHFPDPFECSRRGAKNTDSPLAALNCEMSGIEPKDAILGIVLADEGEQAI